MADIDEEDPYALSSDSEDEQAKGPPPKINIEERAIADISSLVSLFTLYSSLSSNSSCLVYLLSFVTKTRSLQKLI